MDVLHMVLEWTQVFKTETYGVRNNNFDDVHVGGSKVQYEANWESVTWLHNEDWGMSHKIPT